MYGFKLIISLNMIRKSFYLVVMSKHLVFVLDLSGVIRAKVFLYISTDDIDIIVTDFA